MKGSPSALLLQIRQLAELTSFDYFIWLLGGLSVDSRNSFHCSFWEGGQAARSPCCCCRIGCVCQQVEFYDGKIKWTARFTRGRWSRKKTFIATACKYETTPQSTFSYPPCMVGVPPCLSAEPLLHSADTHASLTGVRPALRQRGLAPLHPCLRPRPKPWRPDQRYPYHSRT